MSAIPVAALVAGGGCSGDDKLTSARRGTMGDAGAPSPDISLDGGTDVAIDGGACGIHLTPHEEPDAAGCTTSLSGTVFAPNGTLPLYDAIVYVPKSTPSDVVHGATCDPCGKVTGVPSVATLSRYDGTFTLNYVPAGKDVPLVIEIGKWRRQVTIPEVPACQRTEVPVALTRLPRTQAEGDLPRIALTTGECDQVGCVLPKLGIAASEFGVAADGAAKSVHVYRTFDVPDGGTPTAPAFWSDAKQLRAYDLVVLSCECWEALESAPGGTPGAGTKGAAAFAAMSEYLAAGGRIFTTDFMYTWYRYSPDPGLSSFANIVGGAPAGGNPIELDTCFPKGGALGAWLETVAPGSQGRVGAASVFANFGSVDAKVAQVWASSAKAPAGPRVVSVNVPVGVAAAKQCGKAVHVDAHVTAGSLTGDVVDMGYPKGCTPDLVDTEKLLAFFLFDLASCIQDDHAEPKPPEPPK